jgi:hypothetical protein
MMATKAEETLITAILTEDGLHPLAKLFAGQLAALRPDGTFTLVKGEVGKSRELHFRYKTESKRSKLVMSLGFELTVEYQTSKKTDLILMLNFTRCKVEGGGSYTSQPNKNGDRIRPWQIQDKSCVFQDVEDVDFEFLFTKFEGQLMREVVVAENTAIRRAANKIQKAGKHEKDIADLRFRLETQHQLIGNERAVRLFDYLYRHNAGNLKGLEKQFNEMAFIVQ